MKLSVQTLALLFAAAHASALVGCSKSETAAPEANAQTETAAPAGSGELVLIEPEELHPEIVIDTTLGPITLVLDAEAAPVTVKNFLNYVNSSHYDETIFHQVEDGFMVLGGGFTADLREKPTLMPIRNEAHNGLKNLRGTVGMFRDPDDVDSASSRFYINLADNPNLDYKGPAIAINQNGAEDLEAAKFDVASLKDYGYCVFGKVSAGMDTIEKMSKAQVTDQGDFRSVPVEPIAIRTTQRLR